MNKTNITYPTVDFVPQRDVDRLGGERHNIRAIFTGEYREPKAKEWFLSGAVVEAYHAGSNLSIKYYIAELVQVRIVISYEIIKN